MADGKVDLRYRSVRAIGSSRFAEDLSLLLNSVESRRGRIAVVLGLLRRPIVFRSSHGNVLLDVMQLKDVLTFA